MGADLLRNLVLAVPLTAVSAVAGSMLVRDPARLRRDAPLALLGFVVSTVGVLVTHLLLPAGLWEFAPAPATIAGLPVEALLGWGLLWGALPALAPAPCWLWFMALVWFDVVTMPALAPFLQLTPDWWWGEAALLGLVAAPTLLLLEATRRGRWLWFRVATQGLVFGTAGIWGVGSASLAHDDLTWADLVDHPLPVRAALVALLTLVAVPALAAVAELARVGGGTPYPWDPPERLVTTGPYAYLANPMQVGMVGILLVLALAAGSPTLLLAAGLGVAFSAGTAELHERHVAGARWPEYANWRAQVRGWWPRWRPHITEPATLWVSASCSLCRATGDQLDRMAPRGLTRRDAEQADFRITRMRWSIPGHADRGVAAWARALEHVNLSAAWWGWTLRLPGFVHVVQLVADACGLGPRDLQCGRHQSIEHRPEGAR